MEWYNILTLVLGGIGGTAGIVGLYKAKAEKTSIDIDNMQNMLDEARKMYNLAREETQELKQEFRDYKKENSEYVREFKHRFAKVELELENTKTAVNQSYRCPFPPKQDDCPVLQEYNKDRSRCKECGQQ